MFFCLLLPPVSCFSPLLGYFVGENLPVSTQLNPKYPWMADANATATTAIGSERRVCGASAMEN